MTNDEWVKEAERLAERLAMKARREDAYLGGPMAEKYTGERKAAQSLLMLHISARPEPQAEVSEEREAFEEWATPKCLRFSEQAWEAWNARAVLAASRQVPVGDDAKDAARYRWLRDRFFGADFDYGGDEENAGRQVLLIEWDGGKVWGSLDLTVDAALPSPLPVGEPRQEEGERSGSSGVERMEQALRDQEAHFEKVYAAGVGGTDGR